MSHKLQIHSVTLVVTKKGSIANQLWTQYSDFLKKNHLLSTTVRVPEVAENKAILERNFP